MRSLLIVICAVSLLTTISWCQQDIYLMGGVSFPVKPDEFSKFWKTGMNFGAGLGWRLTPNVSTSIIFEMNSFPFNSYDEESTVLKAVRLPDSNGISLKGGSSSISIVSINGKFNTMPIDEASISPYILVGAGYMFIGTPDGKITSSRLSYTIKGNNETVFVGHIGIGIDFQLSKNMGIFIESKYALDLRNYFYTAFIPVKLGFRILN